MSKPLPAIALLAPDEQLKIFIETYRDRVHPATHARLRERTHELSLHFAEDELLIIAALDTPDKVQEFLNTQIYYNNDHAYIEQDETALPPRCVLQTGLAHCFEGALFAYTVNFLHGHNPRLVLLEASQDSEHNLVLFQDPQTGLYGCNAHSRFLHLDGRHAQYVSIRALAESYVPYYYSDRTNDANDLTLVGYSNAFDLDKFGVAWMDSTEMLWDIYYTYIDATVHFHYLFDNSKATHLYSLIVALQQNWIQLDASGQPSVNANALPCAARDLWQQFWRVFPPNAPRPRGAAREIEKQFFKLTGTTPIDLNENAEEVSYFLEKGYHVEQLLAHN